MKRNKKAGSGGGETHSDALVCFGMTGDLAYKKIFPALYAMAKRGALNVPVVGVASSDWTVETLRARAKDAVMKSGGIDNPKAFKRLLSLLRFVHGEYEHPNTYRALKKELGGAKHPAFYLAIPPFLFETVIQKRSREGAGLARRRARGRREAVRARPGLGAGTQRRRSLGVSRVRDFPHRPLSGQGGDREHPLLPLRQLVPGADLEPAHHVSPASRSLWRWKENFGVQGRGAFYETAGCLRDVVQNHMFQVIALLAMEPPASEDPEALRDEKAKVFRSIRPLKAKDLVRGQFPGYRKEAGVAKNSDVETFCALRLEIDSWRWAGVPWYLRSGKRLPETAKRRVAWSRSRLPPQKIFSDSRAGGRNDELSPLPAVALPGHRAGRPHQERGGIVRRRSARAVSARCPAPRARGPATHDRLLGDCDGFGKTGLFARRGLKVEARLGGRGPPAPEDHHRALPYRSGTWGPEEADALIAEDGGWHNPVLTSR